MIGGYATPTESAAIGAAAAIALAVSYRALTVENLLKSLMGTVVISGMILFIIVGATTFAQVLSFSGATDGIVLVVSQTSLSSTAIIIGMLAILVVLGIFMDQVSMMLVTLPIFMPLVGKLGVDPVWFGVMFLICMQLGFLLPPHGLLLMTMKGVTPPSSHDTRAGVLRAKRSHVSSVFDPLGTPFDGRRQLKARTKWTSANAPRDGGTIADVRSFDGRGCTVSSTSSEGLASGYALGGHDSLHAAEVILTGPLIPRFEVFERVRRLVKSERERDNSSSAQSSVNVFAYTPVSYCVRMQVIGANPRELQRTVPA
eukprot:gene41292-55849_t